MAMCRSPAGRGRRRREALCTYARTDPHKSLMTGLRETMRDSTFTFWEVPVGALPLDWDDAKRRPEDQARTGTPAGHGTGH